MAVGSAVDVAGSSKVGSTGTGVSVSVGAGVNVAVGGTAVSVGTGVFVGMSVGVIVGGSGVGDFNPVPRSTEMPQLIELITRDKMMKENAHFLVTMHCLLYLYPE